MTRYHDYEPEEWDEMVDTFAEPGGNSALLRATQDNPRNLPCPTCHYPNRLTPEDRAHGYQCNSCANAMECGGEINYYEGDDEEPYDPDEEYEGYSDSIASLRGE
jgi:hypothetical protein